MDNTDTRKKAEKTGIYIVKDGYSPESHMRFKEGDFLPDGAEWRDEGEEIEGSPRKAAREQLAKETEERAKGAAPENRAKGAAPESK